MKGIKASFVAGQEPCRAMTGGERQGRSAMSTSSSSWKSLADGGQLNTAGAQSELSPVKTAAGENKREHGRRTFRENFTIGG